MRRTVLRRMAALLAAAAAFAPGVAAGTDTVPVAATDLRVRGALDVVPAEPWDAAASGILFVQGDVPQPAELALTSPRATVRVVNLPTVVLLGGPATPVPAGLGEQEWHAGRASGPVAASDAVGEESTTYRILPAGGEGALDLDLPSGAWSLSAPSDPAVRNRPTAFAGRSEVAGHAVLPAGPTWTASGPAAGRLAMDQPFVALLFGGWVRWDDEAGPHAVRAGPRVNETLSAALGDGGAVAYDNVVVVVEAPSGAADTGGAATAWRYLLARADVPAASRLAMRGTDGTVWMGSQAVAHRSHLLELDGRMRAEGRLEGQEGVWSLEGHATRVAVDAGIAWTSPPVIGAGALALAALLLSGLGRGLLTVIIGRSTPRLLKASLHGSAGRRKVLQSIHALQPVPRSRLQAQTGLSRTAVAYHLRILQAHEVVERVAARPGGRRGDVYVINSSSMRIPLDLPGAQPPDLAVGALAAVTGHPVRRALFDAIAAVGPADAEALARRVAAAGGLPRLARATASRHLRILVASGAVHRERCGRRLRYRAALHPGRIAVAQAHRLLPKPEERALASALARGAVQAPALPGPQRRAAERLVELGLALPARGRTLEPTPALAAVVRNLQAGG